MLCSIYGPACRVERDAAAWPAPWLVLMGPERKGVGAGAGSGRRALRGEQRLSNSAEMYVLYSLC